MDPRTTCTEVEGLLPLFIGGDLEGDDIALVAVHVEGCERCAEALEGVRRARQELRAGLQMAVEGREPQLWPAIRSELHREGLLRAPGEPVSLRPLPGGADLEHDADRAPARPASLPRVAVGMAAGIAAVLMIGRGFFGGPELTPQDPGGSGGDRVVERQAAPTPNVRGLDGSAVADATLGSEARPKPSARLRPVGFENETLFDGAREDLLRDAQEARTLQPGVGSFLPSPSSGSAGSQGELVSGFKLQ
ncbi:MAG: zf-HC2 domain-containing protein [Planctomycetota bacterium]|nr:zf-HC2 domain-containing protein [Planctomycetota bacterium]